MQTTLKFLFAAGLLSAACVPAAFAAQSSNVFGQSTDEQVGPIEAVAREAWRSSISQIATPAEGCYQATYPSIVWEQTACRAVTAHTHPLPRKAGWGAVQTTGNGNDYAIVTSTNMTAATGSFPSVSGLTSEKGVGVSAFGGGGILGANEYTLQVNSNADSSTAACGGHSGCIVWQQFIYSPDYETQGEAAVFMQYWLIYYGSSRCPSGWGSDGEGDCYRNSSAVTAPDVALTSSTALSNLKMEGTAASGGNDTAVFTNGTHAYSVSGKGQRDRYRHRVETGRVQHCRQCRWLGSRVQQGHQAHRQAGGKRWFDRHPDLRVG